MRRNKFGLAFVGLAALLVIAGGQFARAARQAQAGQPAPGDQQPKSQRYVLTGTVQSIDAANHQIMVDGDAIPGYMDAMSMPYSVPDKNAIAALNVGDIIHADLVVQGNDSHLENIKVTGHAKPKS